MILNIPLEVLSEVADIWASAVRMGIQVGWLDKILGQIVSQKQHLNLRKKSKDLRKRLEQIDHEWQEISRILGEAEAKMIYKDYDLHQFSFSN